MTLIRLILRLIATLRQKNQELTRIADALDSISSNLRPKTEPLSLPVEIRPARIHRIETKGTWW